MALALDRQTLLDRFWQVRRRTEGLAALLSPEDQQVQSMPDASPTKWHLAHTTWFFEQFLLGPAGIAPCHEGFAYLFNSYYDGVGARHPRAQRGLLTRPDHATIGSWRRHVDDAVTSLLSRIDDAELATRSPIVWLGLAHEEQHQELIVTDALHLLLLHPWKPALQSPTAASVPASVSASVSASASASVSASAPGSNAGSSSSSSAPPAPAWIEHPGGVVPVGRDLHDTDLVFDNEGPAHRVFLEPFALSSSLVSVGALRAFIEAGGYETPSLWLAAGFDHVRAAGRRAPAYVRRRDDDGALLAFTVQGERALHDDDPVTHVDYFEADALARFLGARLPTEAEWEVVARDHDAPAAGFDLTGDDDTTLTSLRPSSAGPGFFGVTWQWTQSSYQAFPGYRPAAGVVGEYNGKFMVGQYVLRGSSSYTPRGHGRATYRNFWPPATSFQNTGLRLARDR